MAARSVSFAPDPAPPSSGIPFRINIITGIATQRMPWQESTQTVTVLPLMTLADKTAVDEILVQAKRLAAESKIDDARTCISTYKKSLRDPLDPQKLIWRAICTIQLSFLELMDLTKIPEKDFKDPRNRRNDPRYRLIDTLDISPNQRKLEKSRVFLVEALQDLEAAQLGTASDAIITQNALRKELYQDLLWCCEALSENHLSSSYVGKIRELKDFCTPQLPKPPQTPVRPGKIPSGYSTITKLFIFAVIVIAVVGVTTLYKHYRITHL